MQPPPAEEVRHDAEDSDHNSHSAEADAGLLVLHLDYTA